MSPSPEAATRRRTAHLALALTLAGLILLALFPPARYAWYPPCPIYHWFGILCPGCGATRALSALLRGDPAQALHQNALAVLLFPAAVALGIQYYRRALSGQSFHWPHLPAPATAALTTAALVFSILRNIH